MCDFIVKHPRRFGYKEVFIIQKNGYDLLGIKPSGRVEKIEVERQALGYLQNHNSNDADRVIAYFNTPKRMPVPLVMVPKKDFLTHAAKIDRMLKK